MSFPADYVRLGHAVRILSARPGGKQMPSVGSGSLFVFDEDEIQIDTRHIEPGQSGGLIIIYNDNTGEVTILGVHIGATALKPSYLRVNDQNRQMMETKIMDASLADLNLAASQREIELAQCRGTRGFGATGWQIRQFAEEIRQGKVPSKCSTDQAPLATPTMCACGLPRQAAVKFCSDCGACIQAALTVRHRDYLQFTRHLATPRVFLQAIHHRNTCPAAQS